ncbi:MAG TPA: methylmalonyl Co-A mutase-associated GTPase MeaB [Gammaproteobacteria bacterium]|nr:methylmalonyl Co-A mutase-associated GTPase MeaB [Gammaproteobacteria bacterium]
MNPPPATEPSSVSDLAAQVCAGKRTAIARAISSVEAGGRDSEKLLHALHDATGRTRRLGITGAPGVGKSTLAGALIAELRKRNQSVAVIAVDPTSPMTGGAILGDRVRMTQHHHDDGVFIRSLASRGSGGGLSLATSRAVEVLDAAGFENVIIETVGAGQSDIDVADIVDVTAVVCAPGLGDDIQAMKAGLLEVADVLVVNKADDPMAVVTAKQLESMLALRPSARQKVPVLKTAAREAAGIPELVDVLEDAFRNLDHESRAERRLERTQRLLATVAGGIVARRLKAARGDDVDRVVRQTATGELDVESAAMALLNNDVWRNG